jgi:hypothetical protein
VNDAERLDKIEERLTKLEAAFDQRLAAEGGSPFQSFPEPLAYALGRYGSAATHSGRFFLLLDAGEIAIKYSWSLAMAFAPSDAAHAVYVTPPTLGVFASRLRSFLDSRDVATTTEPILRALARSFRKDNGKPTPAGRYLLDEFVVVRNRERGHASTLTEGAYESLWRSVHPVLMDTLAHCEHLRFHCVRIESVDVGNPDWFTYSITELKGVAPKTAPMAVLSKDRIRQGSVCLWDGAMRLVSLSPFIEYRACGVCGLEHTFFLEKVDGQTLHLHSYAANHRMSRGGGLDRP